MLRNTLRNNTADKISIRHLTNPSSNPDNYISNPDKYYQDIP